MKRQLPIVLAVVFATLAGPGCARAPVSEDPDVDLGRPTASRPRSRPQTAAPEPAATPTREPAEPMSASGAGQSDEAPGNDKEASPSESRRQTPLPSQQAAAEPPSGPSPPAARGGESRGEQAAQPQTAPAFPGRETRDLPATPAAAAAAGRRKLQSASAAAQRGDRQTACRLALDACSAVAAHAATDAACRRVANEAERLIEQAGSRPAGPVGPTRFE